MPALPKIYVDFSARDLEGRFYVARLSRFPEPVGLFDRFTGTDFEDFEVECEVLAIDRVAGRVFHRPVRSAEVPGTFQAPRFVEEVSGSGTGSAVVADLDFEPHLA